MATGNDCHTKNTHVRFGESEAALLRFPKDCVDLAFDYFHSKYADVDISKMNRKFNDKGCMAPSLRRDCARAIFLQASKIEFCRKNHELFDQFKKTRGWNRECHSYAQLSEGFADDLFRVVFGCNDASVSWDSIVLAIVMTTTFVRHATDGSRSPDCIMATFSGLYLGLFKVLDAVRCLRGWDCFLEYQKNRDNCKNESGLFQSTVFKPAVGEPSTKCGGITCTDLFCDSLRGQATSGHVSRGRSRLPRDCSPKRHDPRVTTGFPCREPDCSPSARSRGHGTLNGLSTSQPLKKLLSSRTQPPSALGAPSILDCDPCSSQRQRSLSPLSSRHQRQSCEPCPQMNPICTDVVSNARDGGGLKSFSPMTLDCSSRSSKSCRSPSPLSSRFEAQECGPCPLTQPTNQNRNCGKADTVTTKQSPGSWAQSTSQSIPKRSRSPLDKMFEAQARGPCPPTNPPCSPPPPPPPCAPCSLREEFTLPSERNKCKTEVVRAEGIPLSFATEGRELVLYMLEGDMGVPIPRDMQLIISCHQMKSLEKRRAAVKILLCKTGDCKTSKVVKALQQLTAAYRKFCEKGTSFQEQICTVTEILGGLLTCIEIGNWEPVNDVFIVLSELVRNLTITHCPTLKMLSEAAYHTFLNCEMDIIRKLGRWEQFAEQDWC